jgi:hypothetical protein
MVAAVAVRVHGLEHAGIPHEVLGGDGGYDCHVPRPTDGAGQLGPPHTFIVCGGMPAEDRVSAALSLAAVGARGAANEPFAVAQSAGW